MIPAVWNPDMHTVGLQIPLLDVNRISFCLGGLDLPHRKVGDLVPGTH